MLEPAKEVETHATFPEANNVGTHIFDLCSSKNRYHRKQAVTSEHDINYWAEYNLNSLKEFVQIKAISSLLMVYSLFHF